MHVWGGLLGIFVLGTVGKGIWFWVWVLYPRPQLRAGPRVVAGGDWVSGGQATFNACMEQGTGQIGVAYGGQPCSLQP